MASHFPTPSHHPDLPKVGETRCYWSLLSADLRFLFVDPVLCSHLENQAPTILGKSLLDFVHPDEVDNARNDLGSIIEQRGLHGSVTRVRYCRLSAVRTRLGFKGPTSSGSMYQDTFPDARKIAYDEHYMACELVLNWAADHPNMAKFGGGIVLCFLHAAIDINAVNDNDERRKTTWTNWCQTPIFEREHVEALRRRLIADTPATSFTQPTTPLTRVFQIIANVPERHVLFSWPPTPPEFQKLAKDVHIDPSATFARTGCQRRFQARDMILGKQVESIFIPHGSIIFACHTLNGAESPSGGIHGPVSMQSQPYYTGTEPPNQAYYDAAYNYANRSGEWQSNRSPYASTGTSSPLESQPPPAPAAEQWNPHTHSPSPPNSANTNNTSYSPWGAPAPTAIPPVQQTAAPAPPPPPKSVSPSMSEIPPPARQRTIRQISRSDPNLGHQVGHQRHASGSQSLGRTSGHPPLGVTSCASCKTASSPEWRKGPSGKKELCNACGLRYARSRAKKDGHQPQKRRKDEKSSTAGGSGDPSPPTTAGALSQATPSPQSSSFSQSHIPSHTHSQSLDFQPQRRGSDHYSSTPYENASEQGYTAAFTERTRSPSPPPPPSSTRDRYGQPTPVAQPAPGTATSEAEEYDYSHRNYRDHAEPVSYYATQSSSLDQQQQVAGYTHHPPTHPMLPRITSPDASSSIPALPPFGAMTRGGSGGIRSQSPLVGYEYRAGHGGYAITAPSSYERGGHQAHHHIPLTSMRHSTGA